MAHVTDYDVWRLSEDPVTVDLVIQTLNKNTSIAREVIKNLVINLNPVRMCNCDHALADALITRRDVIPNNTILKLEPLVKKYMGN
jgi:5'-methylthioadenosine phosphorylase